MCHHAQQLRTRSRFRCDATICTGSLPRKVQMARFVCIRSQCQFDTPGERRFTERLEKLPDGDYLCWSSVPVRPQGALSRLCGVQQRRRRPHPQTQECKLAWGKWKVFWLYEVNLSPFLRRPLQIGCIRERFKLIRISEAECVKKLLCSLGGLESAPYLIETSLEI